MEVKKIIEDIATKETLENKAIREAVDSFPSEMQVQIRLLCKQCFLRGFVTGVEETLRWKVNIDF